MYEHFGFMYVCMYVCTRLIHKRSEDNDRSPGTGIIDDRIWEDFKGENTKEKF